MANYPKKVNDPTEAALSAIQEALNIREEDDQPASPAAPAPDLFITAAENPPQIADTVATKEPSAKAPSAGDVADVAGRAANDDQQSIGQILHALQRRPARSSYFVAALFSGAWIVGCLGLSLAYFSELHTALGTGRSPVALVIGLGAAALLPVIFFFGVAHMVWRAQELRVIAQSMARVAMRLAQPESVARDSIVTVGQAIRREVAAMGDGVERALARASELEALVQSEVAALERTYSENEVRIRGVLQDLGNQRDTLVGQAEHVRAALGNVQIDLTQDLSTISDLVGQQVSEAAQRITQSLAEKGEHITATLAQIGDNMVQQLSQRGGDMLDRLEAASEETSRAIALASDRLSSNLDFKTNHIGEEFAEIANGLEDMMTARLDRVAENFSEKSLGVVDLMVGRSQALTDAIVETSNQLAEAIATRADEANSTLKTSGDSLLLGLDLRGSEVAAKLEQAGGQVTQAMIARSATLTDELREAAEHVTGVVATRSDALKEMLQTRLSAFEEMFGHTGTALGEKISRDSSTLGNLITRHLAEFDRTVKTYGAELVERLGTRTQDVSESMRGYLDSFDGRVTSKANEVSSTLDQRLARFQETLESRSEALTNALSARVGEVGKTLAEGGKEVMTALDKRITDVTTLIDTRATKLGDTLGERIATIDTTLGKSALEVVGALDHRVAHLEQLLIGRAEAVVQQMEVRSRAAADLLNSRLETLSDSIKTNSTAAERALTQLAANTTEALGKSAAASAAATEALNRGAAEATVSLNRSAGALSNTIVKSATSANEAIGKAAATAAELLAKTSLSATEALNKATAGTAEMLAKTSQSSSDAIVRSAGDAERKLVGMSAEISRNIVGKANEINSTLTQRVDDMAKLLDEKSSTLISTLGNKGDQLAGQVEDAERKLVGMSAEISRNIVSKTNEINGALTQRVDDMAKLLDEKSSTLITALANKGDQLAGQVERVTEQTVQAIDAKGFVFTQRVDDMAKLLDEKSSTLISTLGNKGDHLAGQVERVTEQTVKAIDARGLVFTQAMMDKSEEIARLINDASLNATAAVTRTLGQMQEGAQGVTEAAKSSIVRSLEELQRATTGAIEQSKQTAAATVAEMMETHTMLRSDSTALFERLREANILLQEVLSGAHENMSSIEHTMATRVSEFVAAMTDLSSKTGVTTSKVEQHLGNFNTVAGKALGDLGELANQFSSHGRTLTDAVALLESGNRRTEESISGRQAAVATLVSTLDARAEDFGQRLARFSSALDESLRTATARAGEIAGMIAQTSSESVQTIEQQYEVVRKTSEEERTRTSDALTAAYDEAFSQVQNMFTESTARFSEVMQGMKRMAAEMQQELEATREQLRRGVLELPQETAESTAQMRRVIVDQIEALAELNRIVARHGRALDAFEPVRRDVEPLYAAGGGRAQARPVRADVAASQQAPARDITGAPTRRTSPPTLSPVPGGKDDSNSRNGGWLSELLTRASREPGPQSAPVTAAEASHTDDAAAPDSVDSPDALSVDIARMIDNDAAADLWERYKRGERGAFTKRLYTAQGQRAFEEIRGKYRSDADFRQTVEHYIHEFERLLDDVSRGDRGPAVARNYLASDTGKVYTMLAHAAGRFD